MDSEILRFQAKMNGVAAQQMDQINRAMGVRVDKADCTTAAAPSLQEIVESEKQRAAALVAENKCLVCAEEIEDSAWTKRGTGRVHLRCATKVMVSASTPGSKRGFYAELFDPFVTESIDFAFKEMQDLTFANMFALGVASRPTGATAERQEQEMAAMEQRVLEQEQKFVRQQQRVAEEASYNEMMSLLRDKFMRATAPTMKLDSAPRPEPTPVPLQHDRIIDFND